MSISKIGQRFTAVIPQSGKNTRHPAVGKLNDATNLKTKSPLIVDADKEDKRSQALQAGLRQLESTHSPKQSAKQDSANG